MAAGHRSRPSTTSRECRETEAELPPEALCGATQAAADQAGVGGRPSAAPAQNERRRLSAFATPKGCPSARSPGASASLRPLPRSTTRTPTAPASAGGERPTGGHAGPAGGRRAGPRGAGRRPPTAPTARAAGAARGASKTSSPRYATGTRSRALRPRSQAGRPPTLRPATTAPGATAPSPDAGPARRWWRGGSAPSPPPCAVRASSPRRPAREGAGPRTGSPPRSRPGRTGPARHRAARSGHARAGATRPQAPSTGLWARGSEPSPRPRC